MLPKKAFKKDKMIINSKILIINYEKINSKLNCKWNPFNE